MINTTLNYHSLFQSDFEERLASLENKFSQWKVISAVQAQKAQTDLRNVHDSIQLLRDQLHRRHQELQDMHVLRHEELINRTESDLGDLENQLIQHFSEKHEESTDEVLELVGNLTRFVTGGVSRAESELQNALTELREDLSTRNYEINEDFEGAEQARNATEFELMKIIQLQGQEVRELSEKARTQDQWKIDHLQEEGRNFDLILSQWEETQDSLANLREDQIMASSTCSSLESSLRKLEKEVESLNERINQEGRIIRDKYFKRIGANYFMVSRKKKTFDDARETCLSVASDMAYFETDFEYQQFTKVTPTQ